MAYDPVLADRIRTCLESEADLTERAMFGGLAFLIRGHMTVAAGSDGMMIRADPVAAPELVATTGAEYVEMGGRQLKGWLHLDPVHIASDADLERWIAIAVSFSATLPPKS